MRPSRRWHASGRQLCLLQRTAAPEPIVMFRGDRLRVPETAAVTLKQTSFAHLFKRVNDTSRHTQKNQQTAAHVMSRYRNHGRNLTTSFTLHVDAGINQSYESSHCPATGDSNRKS